MAIRLDPERFEMAHQALLAHMLKQGGKPFASFDNESLRNDEIDYKIRVKEGGPLSPSARPMAPVAQASWANPSNRRRSVLATHQPEPYSNTVTVARSRSSRRGRLIFETVSSLPSIVCSPAAPHLMSSPVIEIAPSACRSDQMTATAKARMVDIGECGPPQPNEKPGELTDLGTIVRPIRVRTYRNRISSPLWT